MTSPPPHLDAPIDLDRWFPDHPTWDAVAAATLKGRPLSSLDVLVGTLRLPPAGPPVTAPTAASAAMARLPFDRWDVRAIHEQADPGALADHLGADLGRGVTSIGLVPSARGASDASGAFGTRFTGLATLREALAHVDLGTTPIAIEAGVWPAVWLAGLAAIADDRGAHAHAVRGAVHACPLSTLATEGRLSTPADRVWDELAACARYAAAHLPGVSTLTIDGRAIGEAGGSVEDELAWVACAGACLLRAMTARGLDADDVARRVVLRLSVGLEVITEVAKLRAARAIWDRLVVAFGGTPVPAPVHAIGSPSWLAALDAPTNLVRTSLQAAAAAMGGADVVTVVPWSLPTGVVDDPARRLVGTAPAVLDLEAHLRRVSDPGAGSGVIEGLSDALARATWASMQEVERDGLLAWIVDGRWARRVTASRDRREQAIRSRRAGIVGVSVSPADAIPAAAPHTTRPSEAPFAPVFAGDDAGDPVARAVAWWRRGADPRAMGAALHPTPGESAPATPPWRAARPWEDLRRRLGGRRPTFTLVPVGEGAIMRARMDFARGLLAAGGWTEEALGGALRCLCPSDDALADLAVGEGLVAVAAPKGTPVPPGVPLLHREADATALLLHLLSAWEKA